MNEDFVLLFCKSIKPTFVDSPATLQLIHTLSGTFFHPYTKEAGGFWLTPVN